MVLPLRPEGTEGLSEAELAALVTPRRDDRRGARSRLPRRRAEPCAISSSAPTAGASTWRARWASSSSAPTACCCGRVQDGYAPVPRDLYHAEWERRGLRNRVHLTIGGCLGPCALANVVMLLFDGRQAWFHSIVVGRAGAGALRLDRGSGPRPGVVAAAAGAGGVPVHRVHVGRASRRQARGRPPPPPRRAAAQGLPRPAARSRRAASSRPARRQHGGPIAVPRKNGELVFEEPWEGRVFGMAVALHDQRLYGWEEFQREPDRRDREGRERAARLRATTSAGSRPSSGCSRTRASSTPEELDDRTEAFEFGERDEVY